MVSNKIIEIIFKNVFGTHYLHYIRVIYLIRIITKKENNMVIG